MQKPVHFKKLHRSCHYLSMLLRHLVHSCTILQAVSRHPTAGPKQASQEQLSPDREGLTYNQLSLMRALMQRGIAWNDVIKEPPGPVPTPQADPGSMGNPQQGSGAEAVKMEDDDVIPF